MFINSKVIWFFIKFKDKNIHEHFLHFNLILVMFINCECNILIIEP